MPEKEENLAPIENCDAMTECIGISMAELLVSSKTKKEEILKGLCMLYVASEGEERKTIAKWIYTYCYHQYFKIFKTYGVDRRDVFETTMMRMLDNGIETYIKKCRSSTFEAHLLVKARNVAFELANPGIKAPKVHYYNKLKDLSETYNIPLCIENAWKFEKLLQVSSDKESISLNEIITVLESNKKVILFSDLNKNGEYL